MKNICSIFVLLTILTVEIFSQSQQSKTIYGFISDSLTGEKLSYVTVTVEKSIVDIRSNQYSYYTVTTNEPLPIKIKFSRYGYNPLVIVVHDTNQTIQRNVSLLSRTFEMPEVLVEGMSNEILLEKHSFGLSTMQIESFKKTPSIGGEMDILKGMQHLAGVLPGQEFSTELHIRGGEQSENTILLDDMPLYNVGHLFGFFSVFNGDVLQEVELFKGAIPANYGGKLSSVLRVTQKEGNKEKFKTQGGISMLTSRLFVEGPISDIGSFLLAGRRTYLDPVLEIAASNEADNFSLYFYDLNLKTNFTLSATDKIFISGYFGRDNLNMSDLNRLSQPDIYYQLVWGNAGYNVRYLKILSPQIFVSSSIIFSDYRSSFYFGDDDITHSTPSITDLIFSLQTDYFISATSTLQFGLSHTTHSFNFVNDFLKLSTNKKMQFLISSKETRGFVSITSYIDEVIRINLGMNVGYFSSGNYIETDPRLSLTYFLNPHQAVNISYTRMHQFIHLFASVDIFSPSNLYYPSTNIVPPENSHQWSLGYTSKFDNGF